MADTAAAIAQAVGQIADLANSFVQAGAQRFGLQKGLEANTIAYEQNKTLLSYQGLADSRKTAMFLILGLAALILIMMFLRKRQANGI